MFVVGGSGLWIKVHVGFGHTSVQVWHLAVGLLVALCTEGGGNVLW